MIREEKEEEEEEEEEEEQNGRVVLCVNQFTVPSSSRMNAEMSLSASRYSEITSVSAKETADGSSLCSLIIDR